VFWISKNLKRIWIRGFGIKAPDPCGKLIPVSDPTWTLFGHWKEGVVTKIHVSSIYDISNIELFF
jgi:hypothetical protein